MRFLITLLLSVVLSFSAYTQSVTFTLAEEEAAYGDVVCLDVTVQNFTAVVSFQYSINYDPAFLSFVGTDGYNLQNFASGNVGNPSAGDITISWVSDDLINGTSVADGTSIFQLCFHVLLASELTTPIVFSDMPIGIEASDNTGNLIDPLFVGGSITVVNDGNADVITLYASQDTVMTGETVVVPITVENFVDILTFQFSLHYDSLVLRFVEAGDFSLPYLGTANLGTPPNLPEGTITVAWYDEEIQARTLEDGDTLFTITFEVIGSPGTMSPVFFSGFPTSVEISTISGVAMSFNLVGGGIYVFQEVGTHSVANPLFRFHPLSPNPMRTESYLTFELQKSSYVQWRVVDATGRIVYQEESYLPFGKHHISLHRDKFPSPGTYMIELHAGGYRAVRSLVVLQ